MQSVSFRNTLVIYLVIQKLQEEIWECYLKGEPSPEWHQNFNTLTWKRLLTRFDQRQLSYIWHVPKVKKIHLTSSECSSKASGFDRPHHIIVILTLYQIPAKLRIDFKILLIMSEACRHLALRNMIKNLDPICVMVGPLWPIQSWGLNLKVTVSLPSGPLVSGRTCLRR